jgi:hypothetical protein
MDKILEFLGHHRHETVMEEMSFMVMEMMKDKTVPNCSKLEQNGGSR